ncbi:hypothetical protein V496_02130 [Pseudogymnoascus sp. VKM F-4515 (FW-2607)]|nr:hypothetical protein V496_02130 [Pseudogymnoascus sp. VKM F-4515 (FW-2607)]
MTEVSPTTPFVNCNAAHRVSPDVMLREGWYPFETDENQTSPASNYRKERPDVNHRQTVQERIIRENKLYLAHYMANRFADDFPEFTAKTGFAMWQKAAAVSAVGGFAAMLVLFPSVLMLLLALLFFMTAAVNFTVSAVSLLPEKWFVGGEGEDQAKFSNQPDWPLPVYTVLVPVYMESEVMPELIKAMKRLDYPSEKLEIMFLVEEHDQETREAALSAGLSPNMRIVDLPPGNPQTKPRSCNLGLLLARGDLIVIFDAEDRPDPDQLIKAAKAFAGAKDNRLACVQAKLFFYNAKQNMLTHQFALEYALRYGMILPGLTRLGLPIPLGGTSNHFRTDILRRLGGWDAWNVTEDADLGMRCQALGYRVNMIESITWEEATSQPGAWIKQRTRWLKGFLITVLVHTRHPVQTLQRFRPAGMVTLIGIVLGAPLSFLGQPIALMLLLCDLAGFRWSNLGNGWHRGVASILLLIGTLMTMAVTLFAAFRRRISYSHLACLLPGYWALYWVAAWRALFQLVHSPFVWEKTPHGQTTHVTPPKTA